MDIADIEARTKGYDLGEYQLPKAEYNASEDTWSVSYVSKDKDKSSKRLNVTIQEGHVLVADAHRSVAVDLRDLK